MKPATPHPFEIAVASAWPPKSWRDSHVICAVSGGADSVAMLRAISALKRRSGGAGRLLAAHFNHHLRGSAADEDQAWVEELCRHIDVPLNVGSADVAEMAAARGDGLEAAAREARYMFLREVAERIGARCVVLAHTADDQSETVLHRILRGAGLAGLGGMAKARPLSPSVSLVRPMLDIRRTTVLQYLEDIGQAFRQDASNADARWTRNRLRIELLPHLRGSYNSDVDDALHRLAYQAKEAQEFVNSFAADLVEHCVSIESLSEHTTVRIDCKQLLPQPPLVVREVCKLAWTQAGWPLQSMGFDQWQQLAEMVAASEGTSANMPSGVLAKLVGDQLTLRE